MTPASRSAHLADHAAIRAFMRLATSIVAPSHQPETHITSDGWESALAVERVKLPKPFPFGSLGFSLVAALPFRLWPVLTITHGRDKASSK